MDAKSVLLSELVKNGYSKVQGSRVWHMANRSLLYLTPEMSKAFLNLINYEPYRKNVFEVEMKLISKNASLFLEQLGDESFNFVDIGCGDGSKAIEILKAVDGKNKVNYFAISSGKYLADLAVERVKKEKFKNLGSCIPNAIDYKSFAKILRKARRDGFKRNLILLHGSIIASYEINDFLFELSRNMSKQDFVIIGNSIRKGERLQDIEKYKNKFFVDWFDHLMTHLGFEKDEVEYDARFNEMRVEGYFKVKVDKKIKHRNKEINFKKGDEILVAYLYKYYESELDEFFKMYFSDVKNVKDSREEYLVSFCKK